MSDVMATAVGAHPLDALGAEEVGAARDVLTEAGLLGGTARVAYLGLAEPAKADVLAFRPGDATDRRVRVLLLDTATGAARDALVSVTHRTVESVTDLDPGTDGQPPILMDEYELADEIVKADEGWRAAIAARGITDLELVRGCPLSAGVFGIDGEQGRRMLRVLSFRQHRAEDHPWAHPIDGLVAYVDLIEKRVLRLIDTGVVQVPQEEGNYDDPAAVGPARTSLRPLHITQPEGVSFTIEGNALSWENWTLRIGFDAREGLVLHQIGFRDGDRVRPVVYRASLAEMVVAYGDPSPVRFWQNYFDIGEYSLGMQANSLELGCDCLGEIRYLDAVMADTKGDPLVVPNAVCLHEEDVGVLWKHTDLFTGARETRRSRRMVISFFATVGNYDYGFYWYLYLDGTIELECRATGILFTSAHPGGDFPWATEVAPGLGGPHHQHMFCARLDMMVDGPANAVDEVDAWTAPVSEDNPHGNAFTRTATRLASESQADRLADPGRGRVWSIVNPSSVNRLGRPVSYVLRPEGTPVLLADPGSSVARRAAFATRHLWVTQYDPDQRYPAGDLVNQHPGGGLPDYVAADRPLNGADLVVWHTFGMTHFPRVEDWPIMPVDTCGFTLRPVGFFDRNPALDVPPPSDHC